MQQKLMAVEVERLMSREEAEAIDARIVAPSDDSPFFELAFVLVRLDHVASFIVNANHSIM
jgi:hypothetical protein